MVDLHAMRPASRTEGGMTVLDVSSSTPRGAETRQEATYRLVIAPAWIVWPDSDRWSQGSSEITHMAEQRRV